MRRIHALALALCVSNAVACDGADATGGDSDTDTPSSSMPTAGASTEPGSGSGQTGEDTSSDSSDTADTSGPGGETDEDFFEFTVVGGGLDRTVTRSFSTEEAWGNVDRVMVDDGDRDRLYLAFPLGDGNIALNLIASGPGTYALPQDIPVYPDILDVSFIAQGELMSFRSTNVSLTLDVLEYNADPDAKTQAGLPMAGFANVEGTFAGTFEEVKANPGDRSPKLQIEASGSFRSGENF